MDGPRIVFHREGILCWPDAARRRGAAWQRGGKWPRTMKPGFLCLALALTAIVGPFSTSAAVDKPARADGIPRVSLREAVSLADEFLRTNKIDTSHHQMLE